MKLKLQKSIIITPITPFAFNPTFHKPAHFATGDNSWQPGIRWQTFRFLNKNLGVIFHNIGSINKPKIKMDVYFTRRLSEYYIRNFIMEIEYRYNLNLNLVDFYQHFSKDKFVGPAIARLRGMRPAHQNSLYEYIIIGIVLQNCTIRRSIQMMKVLFEKYGDFLEFGGKKLWCFWAPGSLKNITENELRALKIGYRAKSIKKIDEQFGKGLINEAKLRLENRETQTKELLKLYGIGLATVWYLLFDVFHHWDFFNHVSPWEQKIYSKIFFNKNPKNPVPVNKIIKYFERYGRYKQLAVNYIWEDLWWKRKNKNIPWLEKEVRV